MSPYESLYARITEYNNNLYREAKKLATQDGISELDDNAINDYIKNYDIVTYFKMELISSIMDNFLEIEKKKDSVELSKALNDGYAVMLRTLNKSVLKMALRDAEHPHDAYQNAMKVLGSVFHDLEGMLMLAIKEKDVIVSDEKLIKIEKDPIEKVLDEINDMILTSNLNINEDDLENRLVNPNPQSLLVVDSDVLNIDNLLKLRLFFAVDASTIIIKSAFLLDLIYKKATLSYQEQNQVNSLIITKMINSLKRLHEEAPLKLKELFVNDEDYDKTMNYLTSLVCESGIDKLPSQTLFAGNELISFSEEQIKNIFVFGQKRFNEQKKTIIRTSIKTNSVESKPVEKRDKNKYREALMFVRNCFNDDEEAIMYLTNDDIEKLVDYLSILGYDDARKERLLKAIKQNNECYERLLIDEAKGDIIEEIFSEIDIVVLNYAIDVLKETSPEYKSIVENVREQLMEIDGFINDMLSCTAEEKQEYKELIKLCFLELNDILDNHFHMDMAMKRRQSLN